MVVEERRTLKILMLGFVFCCVILLSGMTAHAQSVNEIEPNDTMETAQLILANSETAAQAVTGNRPNQYVVNGNLLKTDIDWYKVYLTSGTQYVTCNGKGFDFEVYDSNNIIIASEKYVYGKSFGSTAYPLTVTTAGYYYVKVKANSSTTTSSYTLLVGGPTYTVASCKVNMSSITMDRTDTIYPIDLNTVSGIPDGAVAYLVSLSSVGTNSVSDISVKNQNSTINLTKYSWQKDGLASLNLPVKSRWDITFKYYKNATFTPKFNIYYAYPMTSVYADDITVSR